MKFNSSSNNIENKQKIHRAKIIFFGFVFILACTYFLLGGIKIKAATSTQIIGTMFDKNGDNEIDEDSETFIKKDLTSGDYSLTFIQGNGNNDEVAIKFQINDFPSTATSFIIVESERTDSSTLADADRYNKEIDGSWVASDKNLVKNNISGSAIFTTNDDKINVEITYRLRKGGFGLKFFKVYFYNSNLTDASPSSSIDVVYAIAQPIDMVSQGATCTVRNDTICIDYTNGSSTRESRPLKIFIPTTVAYNFSVGTITTADNGKNNLVVNNYSTFVNASTIYGINYFYEKADGTVSPVTNIADANRSYLYDNFTMNGKGSQAIADDFIDKGAANYTLYLDTFTVSDVSYIATEVDSTGSFIYYIKDIFGNIKEVKQDVTDVKNRAIITEIKKGNAVDGDTGFDADETFTNESVRVEIKMTVETHFELGTCLNDLCTEIINLTKDNVKKVKYWRVNVQIDGDGVDIDAYINNDPVTKDYAHEKYASEGSMFNLFCATGATNCSNVQNYDSSKKNQEDGAGIVASEFNNNVLVMYVGVNGRYRFYIEDIYGNNTWGTESDRIAEEYRNPRVEVYAIDKAAPELLFNHSGTQMVDGKTLTSFDVDTYQYYQGIEVSPTNGKFEYNAAVTDTVEAVSRTIDSQVYYPINRDSGRSDDEKFDDNEAILLSKVSAAEYIYYYNGSKDVYADFSVYNRVGSDYYIKTLYDGVFYDNDISTVLKNTKNNSNGLKLVNGKFEFNEINYYHNDGKTLVCDQIGSITGYEAYKTKNELDCVNYYIDHGVDFIIEFVAEDSVGNIGKGSVYVNVVDTTAPGFTLHKKEDGSIDTSKLLRATNVGSDCRMEIGQEIGLGKKQNKQTLLNCYNVDLNETVSIDNKYNFEDNVYSASVNGGLSYYNRINTNPYVKVFVKSDALAANNEPIWVDLDTSTFIPNKTGYYDIKIVIYDGEIDSTGTNSLTIYVSYYVDRKIVLLQPVENEKFYGDGDGIFDYCVYIDVDNHYDIRFSDNPYSDPTIFTKIYCTNDTAEKIAEGKSKLFQQNTSSDFYGNLSRLESSWYNKNLTTPILETGTSVGVENNYVGLYRMILGTLNINLNDRDTEQDKDYIVKIHPTYRDETKYKGTTGNNVITNNPLEDDDSFAQSNVDFTIKQVVLSVEASGGSKSFGQIDTNAANYNDDDAEAKYLNGFKIADVQGLKYSDTTDVILGVLRREIGENVGVYAICNYRGTGNNDNVLESPNNMYLNCIDTTSPGITFNDVVSNFEGYVYENGILKIDVGYIKSRALYIATNKTVSGKTLNVTTDSRNNNYANYVIKYTGNDYVINPIDLVIQAAPGQRREYNYTDTYDPNPWEIILYGLVDGDIKRTSEEGEEAFTFNGYTLSLIAGDYYEADPNEKDTTSGSEASKLEANKSEERATWYLYHDGVQLKGYKTNETYKLLRDTAASSLAGSAKLTREVGKNGGWYLYNTLSNDFNIVSGTASDATSKIAVITNGRKQCSYDATGHIITGVDGESLCKNYNLIYNPYYTNADGYTIDNNPNGIAASEFVYKSNGKSCLTLDTDLPCTNTAAEEKKIYKIQFEIYRREIILEFNSAIETIKTSNSETWNIFYGKRYNFYESNYFNLNFYTGKNFYPEDYLFLCYQNETEMKRAEFDSTNATSTGCTGDYRYGLTAGDSWINLGLIFKMHEAVSSASSSYYDNDDYAIPAGVYYVYADIADAQKKNYNFKYLGGTLTIKSLSVEVQITSYAKEYGEKYYNKYGVDSNYLSYSSFNECLLDGWFINRDTGLISLGTDVYCKDAETDFGNSEKNIYGFQISGLDSKDTIADNFAGRPNRSRSASGSDDINGLQDNVGTYILGKGTIATINNNPFVETDAACATQIVKGDYGSCVVVSGTNKKINNYVIAGESRTYSFDMKTTVAEEKDVDVATPESIIKTGNLYILPATLTITVATGQTKMYGCAYNAYNATTNYTSYDYAKGYANCVETDGDYYDLGYKYTVAGDKDYQIANNGFDYSSNDSYDVSGILGDTTFRPKVQTFGIKAHALNDGTLYRIKDTTTNKESIMMSSYVAAALSAQKAATGTSKTYQDQIVGSYILTLGNVDATVNEAMQTYSNSCNKDNMPGDGDDFAFSCKNYHIYYYGTKAYDASVDVPQTYTKGGAFPTEILFIISKRTAYVYTSYDQKIYGEADMYLNAANSTIYLCGDNNMDGKVDSNDEVTLENGDIVNKDVYYGFCSKEQVDNNKDIDGTNNVLIDYGLTRYYTKYNSLAKYPWNGIAGRNDVQTDIIAGRISRKGMNGNAPTTDDIKGYYEYVYENDAYYGTVHLIGSKAEDATKYNSDYGYHNYQVNYYENGLAVNSEGKINMTYEGKEVKVQFEIVLRQIKIAFVSFSKVYGEKDVVTDYDILVCAPTEEFDFDNMECINKDPLDKHGLSSTHLAKYTNGGALAQESFKEDFLVRFIRVLGENVSCGSSRSISVQLNGYFFGESSEVNAEGTVYTKSLSCNTTAVSGKSVYETLAYIDQSDNTVLGYNYQVSYQIGYVNIEPRPVIIVPDEGQGFVYGDYYDTLIPAINYKVNLAKTDGDGIVQTYGLVNDVDTQKGICLNNINYYNNGTIDGEDVGTCFYINDRIDEYNSLNSMSTSKYDSSAVNSNTGLSTVDIKNYVFGDVYETESSTRSALDRKLATVTSARYNRNVGVYEITIGDLKDKTGNYTVTFKEGVSYEITPATVIVTPESTSIYNTDGTTQTGQYKVYGEQDKELTFTVKTQYSIKSAHYIIYNSNIVSVCSKDGSICTAAESLERYNYDTDKKEFVKNTEGKYIYVVKDQVVTITGFAYGENGGISSNLNYGKSKEGNKNNIEKVINQGAVIGSKHFDVAGNNVLEGIGYNADKTLSYGETSKILLGYLYVENYAQAAGVYNIVSGFKVAINEFDKENYNLNVIAGVEFTIIPRPIGVQIANVTKTYGQATDIVSCEYVNEVMITPCVTNEGVLISGNDYLRYNFNVVYFNDSSKIESIINNYTYNGQSYNNSKLYSQNGKYVNGLVPETQKAYSAYGTAEDKNSEQLGVYVSRDERNASNSTCLYAGDTFGFCEDVGEYYLRFYGYLNTIDNISKNSYQSKFKPVLSSSSYTGLTTSVSKYYYDSYFGYNPNYFVVVIDNDEDETTITPDKLFASSYATTSRSTTSSDSYDRILKATGKLTINKKNVALYVNTSFFEVGLETYYVGQNTTPPSLPVIDNTLDLQYNKFYGAVEDSGRSEAVYGTDSYGKIIWGTQPNQVRTGDKLVGALAYCNSIISVDDYNKLREEGLTSDYECSNLIYENNKNSVNTNLIGYVPIIRSIGSLSIASATATEANEEYETTNYSTVFYPGALRIEEDDIKPIVEVNRSDVYIEANAIGEYLYECVGQKQTTTYTNCGEGISIVGKTDLTIGDPILDWLNKETDGISNYSQIIKVSLPLIEGCETNEHDCTSSAYFEKEYGKVNGDFTSNGGIIAGYENNYISPFTMQKDSYIKNTGPQSLKEFIITLVSWFGVTSFDQGEIRNGQVLDKKFDKYWYIIIEQEGTNGAFDISKVGEYKVHFYVMDNAGNVSEGNMYEVVDEKNVLQTKYKNVGTLHIVDTTKPIVGTLNLYNGRVECTELDCTKEENWKVAEDTYLPINTLLRYNSAGYPDGNGEYVEVGDSSLIALSSLKKYSMTVNNVGAATYAEDAIQGKYILIAKGKNARALKHYSWSNSTSGIYLTITGGSDNSYTETSFPSRDAVDNSQWNHYYSRDGGITWFLYDKTNKGGSAAYMALDSEGTREILIKAVDSGVAITSANAQNTYYTEKYYGSGNANNVSNSMVTYEFEDTSWYDNELEKFRYMTDAEIKANEANRHNYLDSVGWNVSDAAENDAELANTISLLIYGMKAEKEEGDDDTIIASQYKFYRDRRTAYLDRTSPVISFESGDGEKLYVYEYGCGLDACSVGYTEYYAGAVDKYPSGYKSTEIQSSSFNKNNSIFLNHYLYKGTDKYQESYADISQEKPLLQASNGGLGSDVYTMNGQNSGLDIRSVYQEERRYIIYAFDKNDNRTMYDLSSLIPTSIDSTNGEEYIYDILKKNPNLYSSLGDYTYTIIYSVFDKAGNESVYIARGVLYVDLIPDIEIEVNEAVAQNSDSNYSMVVEQGEDVDSVINNLVVNVSNNANFLTQTVYYNGELVVDNKRYNENIYNGFTTSVPGVYEITYSLKYMYYSSDGQKELIEADPITLTITVEATPPIVSENKVIDYSHIIVLVSLLMSGLFISLFVVVSRKRS